MTLATYRGQTWRVAARHWAPFPYVELETPSGGRCAVPASHIEVLPGSAWIHITPDVMGIRESILAAMQGLPVLEES